METDIVSFELAKYLKQLGFKGTTLKDYWYDGTCHYYVERIIREKEGETVMSYPAPEFQKAVDFLWESGIAFISYRKNDSGKCIPIVIFSDKRIYSPDLYFQYPSQALKHCLDIFTEVSLGKTKLLPE